jgi:LysR family glycine cleavage system transcriptional activator
MVTPGAVSQQIEHLEEVLGLPLFQRLHRSLVLTSHGEVLLPGVSDALERLSAAADALTTDLQGRVLRLGISPLLTDDPEQLLASLAGTKRAPAYVRATSTDDMADLLSGAVDALLRPGLGPYPGMHSEMLDLNPAFMPHARASLVIWPGLAKCREFLKAKTLLQEGLLP